MTRTRRPSGDQAVRDRVVAETDRCCVVDAGAGTGKTTLLVRRGLELIASGRATLDQVAMITFTEKAAGELKVRLRQGIESGMGAAGDSGKRFRAALQILDRAAVTTIHAFAASLLRERPIEAALDPRFKVFDEFEADIVLEESYERFLAESLAARDEKLAGALRLGVSMDCIQELAQRVAANRDMAPPPGPPGPAEEPAACLAYFTERIDRLEVLAKQCEDPDDKGFQQILRLSALVRRARSLDAPAARLRLLLDGKASKTAGSQANWPNPSSLREAKSIFTEMEARRRDSLLQLAGHVAGDLAAWLASFARRYEQDLETRGGLDFQGLLLKTRSMLRDSLEVRGYFQSRYRYLLVDEFQDTDPLQAEIVFLLGEGRPSAADWRESRVAPGRLFIVGDPKQSIYRFRRADVTLYKVTSDLIETGGSGRRERITSNFRTVPGIISWVNGVFGKLLEPDYSPIAPEREALDRAPAIALLPLPPDAADLIGTVDESRSVESALVASLLRRVVEEAAWIVQGRNGQPRPANYGDMAILFRTFTGLENFEEALRSRDIPYRVVGGRTFYARQETRHLQAMLRAIENPHDAISVASALRSPLLGCSDEDLFLYLETDGSRRFDYLRDADQMPAGSPVGDAFRFLRELHRKRNDRPAVATVEEVLDRTGSLALLLLRPQGEQRVANVLKIADLAQRHESAGGGHFGAFVRLLSAREAEERQEEESPTVEEDDQVVRLLTVHKAKGLEFPIVVLADAAGGGSRSDSFVTDRTSKVFHFSMPFQGCDLTTGTWGFTDVRDSEKVFAEQESRRLLYVAATRARDHLVLPVVPHDRDKGSFLDLLREAGALPPAGSPQEAGADGPLAFCRVIDSSTLETASPHVRFTRIDPAALAPGTTVAPEILRERLAWHESLRDGLLRAARGRPVRTASGLEGEIVDDEPGEGEDAGQGVEVHDREKNKPPGEGGLARTSPPLPRGHRRRIGTAVHAVLEALPPAGPLPASDSLRLRVGAAALGEGLRDDAQAEVLRLVEAAFRSSLPERLARARRVFTEHPIAVCVGPAGAEQVLLEGRIDLLFEEDDGCVLVDYKTDALAPGETWERFQRRAVEMYRPQAAAYALALESLGVKVKSAGLLFLDAGKEIWLPVDAAFLNLGRRALLTPSGRRRSSGRGGPERSPSRRG